MSFTPEESMKYQEWFNSLPKDEQDKIRAEQAEQWEAQKTSLAKVKTYAELDEVKQRFVNLLGEAGGRSYVESVVIAVSNKPELQLCTPKSIFISAMRAASLKLSVDPALRQAHLVPFTNKGVKEATLIVDYHGLLSLSESTGYYKHAPHVSEVFEGEEVVTNRFTGEVNITGKKTSDKNIGWIGYFMSKDGIERWEYMTNEQIDAHAQKYNPYGFGNVKGVWHTDRDKMRRKTVLRILLTKWGNFSPEVKRVIQQDEDNIIDATFEMPSDEHIEVPQEEPKEPLTHEKEKTLVSQLGFGEA